MDILKKALIKVKPTLFDEKRVSKIVDNFLSRLNSGLKGGAAVVGGSIAKGTWLKGSHDIDIFVLFIDGDNISERLERVLKKTFGKIERVHGSRDYFSVRNKGFDFEVIPVIKVCSYKDARNVTDVSPLHVQWVNCHLSEKMKDDVRLLKQFCKSCGAYGAETFIKGFSGYVLEVLVANYGSFEKLIRSAVRWKRGDVVGNAGVELDRNKLSPLVVIDPVQPERNANAALSLEKFERFKKACKGFLKKRSIEFFIEKGVLLKDLKKHDLVFVAKPLKGKRDIVGTKLLKAFEEVRDNLESKEFGVESCGWWWNREGEAYFWFDVKRKKLSKVVKHYGPPVGKKENLEEFKKRHKGREIHKENGRVFVNLKRRFVDVYDFVDYLIKEEGVVGRVRSIKRKTYK